MQAVAEKFSSENQALRRAHERMASEVAALMQTDLLRQQDAWKKRWTSLKDWAAAALSNFKSEQTAPWLSHWDKQVYKALEVGYLWGLESLNENLPEMRCDLVIS